VTEDRVVTPYEGSGHPAWVVGAPIPAPLRLHRTTVPRAWLDYNEHMSESCYLLAFGDSADAFFRYLGIDEVYRAAGRSLYTAQTSLIHRREASEGESLSMTMQVLDHDDRRVHVFHEMFSGDSEVLLATAEQMLVHVDSRAGRSTPMPADLLERLAAIQRAHAVLPLSKLVGRPIRIERT
jgi:acyl-CoA thioester hydrolase